MPNVIIKTGRIDEESIKCTGHFINFNLIVQDDSHQVQPISMMMIASAFNQELYTGSMVTVNCQLVEGEVYYRVLRLHTVDSSTEAEATEPAMSPFESALIEVLQDIAKELTVFNQLRR